MKVLAQIMVVSILLCGTLFISSCTDDISSDKSGPSFSSVVEKTNTEIKKEFGAALAKVLAESTPVRELIKKEALKKINYDYDVLYLLVKDEILSDNTTLNSLLLKYVDSDFLSLLETQIPNLTIFVPKLPLNSFSAETWNVDTEVPVVGIRTLETNDVPVFNSQGEESVVEVGYIPAYPIVVVKENERISVKDPLAKSLLGSTLKTKSTSGVELAFLDDVFNNMDEDISAKAKNNDLILTKARGPQIPDNIAKLYETYDVYAKMDTGGWHRDYIYYHIRPDSTKGPIDLSFKECLVGFELRGNPQKTLDKIADQTGDPHLDPNYKHHYDNVHYYCNGWDDGEFEFEVNVYLGGAFPELKTFFRVQPASLFKLTLSGKMGNLKVEKVELNGRVGLDLPLFEWDLEKYSSIIKIIIAEYDDSEVIKRTMSMTTKYATNFGFDASFGEKVKLGMKFGASKEDTRSSSFEVTTTKNSDQLGEVLVNFGDKVLLDKTFIEEENAGRPSFYYPNYNTKYYNDYFRVYIAPVKMY